MKTFRTRVAAAIAAVCASAVAISACSSGSSGTAAGSSGTGTAKLAGTATAGVLKIGTADSSKPYTYTQNGQLTGFDVDLITDAAQVLNLKPQFVTMDFSGLLPAANNGQFDVAAAAIGITAAREQQVTFSDGYLAGYFGVMTRPDSGITSSLSSVKGKTVAVLQGSIEDSNAATLIPGANIVRFPDDNTAALALVDKRVDAFFNDFDPDLSIIAQYPSAHLTQPLTIPATAAPAGWAVKKGNTALVSELNKALLVVVRNGTWLKLYKKYFPHDPVPTAAQLPPYKAQASAS